MRARYDGSCDRCGKPFYAGVDEIKMTPENAWDRGVWYHEDCNSRKGLSNAKGGEKEVPVHNKG